MKVQHISQPTQTTWGWQVNVTYVNDLGLSHTQACCYLDKKPDQKMIDTDVVVVLAKLADDETAHIDAIVEVKLAPVRAELTKVTIEKVALTAEVAALKAAPAPKVVK